MDKTFLAPLGRVEGGPGKVLGRRPLFSSSSFFKRLCLKAAGNELGAGGERKTRRTGGGIRQC